MPYRTNPTHNILQSPYAQQLIIELIKRGHPAHDVVDAARTVLRAQGYQVE
jgi:hypothetical protein